MNECSEEQQKDLKIPAPEKKRQRGHKNFFFKKLIASREVDHS